MVAVIQGALSRRRQKRVGRMMKDTNAGRRRGRGLAVIVLAGLFLLDGAVSSSRAQAPAALPLPGAAQISSQISAPAARPGPTLTAVRQRGVLRCGVSADQPGFSTRDIDGRWQGLDADICRAVAAAALGDADKVDFVPMDGPDRFSALLAGDLDMMARETSHTLSRVGLGLMFGPTVFFDGQGFMVARASRVRSVRELDGARICVQSGSTTQANLADYFKARGLHYIPVVEDTLNQLVADFFNGRCRALTNDSAALAAARAAQAPDPADYTILAELISKEPLAPVVRQGDDNWYLLVSWTVHALIEAEELGVTRDSVDANRQSPLPSVRRLLGVDPGMGAALGVDDAWAARILGQVGNYGEIYDRALGRQSPFRLDRGLNALWNRGGLLYAIPLR